MNTHKTIIAALSLTLLCCIGCVSEPYSDTPDHEVQTQAVEEGGIKPIRGSDTAERTAEGGIKPIRGHDVAERTAEGGVKPIRGEDEAE